MFTVLIYDSRMADLLEDSQCFFEPFLEKEAFVYCRWNPEGTTIEQALPDLYDTVKKETNWRAVILIHGLAESGENPFDFFTGAESGDVLESNPLIRLTHMLAPVPMNLEVRSWETEEGCYQRKLVEANRNYSASYSLTCHRPKQMVLVGTRKRNLEESGVRPLENCQIHYEPQYSQFWSRNEYPANTRFIVYDMEYFQGTIHQQDIFQFVYSLLVLLLNELSSDSLAAYRLYQMSVQLDETALQETLEDFYAQQLTIQSAADRYRAILRLEEHNTEPGSMPNMEEMYEANFPENALKSLLARENGYGLVSDHPVSESIRWRAEVRLIDQNWEEFRKKPMRYLKQTLIRVREGEKSDHLDYELTEEQMEDLKEQMETIEQEMFSLELAGSSDFQEELELKRRSDRRIADYIYQRLSRAQVWGAGAVIVLIFLCSFMPFLWRTFGDSAAFVEALCVIAIVTGTLMGAGLLWLLVCHWHLISRIRHHNSIMRGIVNTARNNQRLYGEYITHAYNYMKYWKILRERQKRERQRQRLRYYVKFHEAASARAMQLCERLRTVYQLSLQPNYDKYRPEQFQLGRNASDSNYYRISPENSSHRIPFNESGEKVYGPYNFIAHFYLKREDMFDD